MSETVHGLLLGPVMCDVAGYSLTEAERQRLRHPLVGGVILFSRNFQSVAQLKALVAELRALRDPALIIAVDHEGGRVQRFRQGFTAIPPMHRLGELWDQASTRALSMARNTGYVLAAELLDCGVGLSFAPVLDLAYGRSKVVGDRAFHRQPQAVQALAQALAAGLREAGMGAVGKHFPGHGYAEADSHLAIPRDGRSFEAIWAEDIQPYTHPLNVELAGVMPAHVIYEAVDAHPAGFSPFWIKDVLRSRLGFKGVVFSDDLTMEGATVAGDIVARAQAAHQAGCDMVLVCNRPDMADDLLTRWQPPIEAARARRIARLQPDASWSKRPPLACSATYLAARQQLDAWLETP
ncbi:beta-N-acetylhexosaminidase [Uliginosibacterium gangwonense]|uniref:beta-N-acetylhexosaminidase n=1 Tax=Uliginosibacterium gangwonense TaxID=392736 RepID=UPI0003709419|nr:beta-N-acetylhexosaminidase [Uliginosibacterium gangwonense]